MTDAPSNSQGPPTWQRGYRVHGLWLGDRRIAAVGLSPRLPGHPREYGWYSARAGGVCTTLRAAKRAAEAAALAEAVLDGSSQQGKAND